MAYLKEIRISNFRGIRHLVLNCAGRSVVIAGSNGTGKSSVVDAIDFLLTGEVRRLAGVGTGSLRLSEHCPHVDAELGSAWVEGLFTCDDGEEVTLRRDVARPSQPKLPIRIPHDLQQLIAAAENGHLILTRRDLLRFICTEPRSRASQVAALMRLSALDSIRLEIQGAAKEARDRQRSAGRRVDDAQKRALQAIRVSSSDDAAVLSGVNERRVRLGAVPLAALGDGDTVCGGIRPRSDGIDPLRSKAVASSLALAHSAISEVDLKALPLLASYDIAFAELTSDVDRIADLRMRDLLTRGIALIARDECPLCRREWDKHELRAVLAERILASDAIAQQVQDLERLRDEVEATLQSAARAVEGLAALVLPAIELSGAITGMPRACADLVAATERNPLEPSRTAVRSAEDMRRALQISLAMAELSAVMELTAATEADQSQLDWDELHTFEQEWRERAVLRSEAEGAGVVASQLAKASDLFVQARDTVLEGIYEALAQRLSEYYAAIHGRDEATFVAKLTAATAGLKLEVDFYGRGAYPPNALHSEGHQDSMGLCLFLALVDRLTPSLRRPVVLDDVVMSVDRGHRRAIAELLRTKFPYVQWIITTHDAVWERQLQTVGLVTSSQDVVGIRSWTIDDGPTVSVSSSRRFEAVEDALSSGNVPGAAHALRRAMEEFLPDVCEALGARVRFRSEWAQISAGDYLGAASGRIKELFKKAREAARTWRQPLDAIEEMEAQRAQVMRQLNAESWAVNPHVHYNEWANMTAEEFAPVVSVHRKFMELFSCEDCGSMVRLQEQGLEEVGLRCSCQRINLNLRKGKGQPPPPDSEV